MQGFELSHESLSMLVDTFSSKACKRQNERIQAFWEMLAIMDG